MMNTLFFNMEEQVELSLQQHLIASDLPLHLFFSTSRFDQLEYMVQNHDIEIVLADLALLSEEQRVDCLTMISKMTTSTKWIIYSNVEHYEYVRSAFKVGVFDYILHHVNYDNVYIVIKEAIESLDQEKSRKQHEKMLLDEVANERASIQITQACKGNSFEVTECLKLLPPAPRYSFCVLHFYQKYRPEQYTRQMSQYLERHQLGNIFSNVDYRQEAFLITTSVVDQDLLRQLTLITEIPFRISESIWIEDWKKINQIYEKVQVMFENHQFSFNRNFVISDEQRRMVDLLKYVDENYMDDISLESLSRRFFLSREHISRRFKQENHQKLSTYIIGKRMEEAKKLLISTNDRILEIAIRLGYQDEKFFSKLFKREIGMTPRQFRTDNKLDLS